MSVLPERILLPTDGSKDAVRAAEAASDLAAKCGAELHVIHVWHDVRGFAHDFVKRELRRQSEEIVHRAQVPVLVLTGADNFWPPARIVVGEDFSDDARKAGELGAGIGKLYGAGGLLVYSHPDLPEVPPGEARSAVQNLTQMRERDKSMLEERASELEEILGRRPEIRISGGYPANVLLEASQEVQPSLVAVGSRGLAGLIRTRLGSVSIKVVTAARGPVLVYPHVD